MKIEGDYVFDAPVREVWDALFDPVILAAVMPGCEKLEKVDGQYIGELNIKIGPVQGKFAGKVDLKDIDEPKSYTMVVDGRGAPGFVKATAAVKLTPDGERTRIHYDADAQVGGKIASVGQRLIDASARAIAKQSLEGLHENVKIRAAQSKAHGSGAARTALADSLNTGVGDAKANGPTTTAERAGASAAVGHPLPAIKSMNQAAFAAAVAKEVTKSLIPMPVLIVAALVAGGLIVWFAVR
jgi:carbon monoxide dehydrogenase subunit G